MAGLKARLIKTEANFKVHRKGKARTGVTGKNGLIDWKVDPGLYRWTLASKDYCLEVPSPMDASPTATGFKVTTKKSAPRQPHLFLVKPGKKVRLDVRVYAPGLVTGYLPIPPGGKGRVVLYNIAPKVVHPKGTLFVQDYGPPVRMVLDRDGRFSRKGLPPGEKSLEACWSVGRENRTFFFVVKKFLLMEGEKKDLGLLEPLAGTKVKCVVRLKIKGKTPASGKPKGWKKSGLQVRVSIGPNWIKDEGTPHIWPSSIAARLDRPFFLQIPPGEYYANAELFEDQPRIPGLVFEGPKDVVFQVPRKETLEIPLPARHPEKLVPVKIVFLPEKGLSGPAEGWIFSGGISKRFTLTLKGKKVETWIEVKPGKGKILLHPLCGMGVDSNFCCMKNLDFPSSPGRKFVLKVGKGSEVRGVFFDKQGFPREGRSLAFSLGPWVKKKDPVYWCLLGKGGAFSLEGVAPGEEILCLTTGEKFFSGPAGGKVRVELHEK